MIYQIKNNLKLLSVFLLISFFLLYNNNSIEEEIKNDIEFNQNSYNEFIEDDIEPFCNGLNYSETTKLTVSNLVSININFINKSEWYENLIQAYTYDLDIIYEKFKNRFDAEIVFIFPDDISCTFTSEIRLSGDFKDHLRSDLNASLDIKLKEGNIQNITKFKLFLPETRRMETEFVTSQIMSELGFLTPRTFLISASINSQEQVEYIFQEKIVKEFLEYNLQREGPLLETSEEYFWENRSILNSDIPILFGKILNTNWVNLSKNNQMIALEALSEFDKLIFQSDGSFLIYNSDDLKYEKLGEFDAALYALDGNHGLAIHNRKFFYDNFKNTLVPIYYDIDSQIASRDLTVQNCSELLQYDYQKSACINNLAKFAKKLLNDINFDSNDLLYSLNSKGIEIEEEFVDIIFNKFVKNLNSIASIGKNDYKFQEDYLNSYRSNYLEYIKNPSIGYYFINLELEQLKFCDAYLSNCYIESSFDSIENNLINNDMIYHLINIEELSENNYNLFQVSEEVFLKTFGNSEIQIDKKNKVLTISIFENEKVIIFGEGIFSDWKIIFLGNHKASISDSRQDENSLTGCLTFYNLKITNLDLESRNNNCEDAINFIGSSGSLKSILVENSLFDSIDIDFSNLEITLIEVKNSGNDCFDVSFSSIFVNQLIANKCSDKALSIGENSSVNLNTVNISDSKIGVAVKDSSTLTLNDLTIVGADMCIATYRKKQEFGSSLLKSKNTYCEGLIENYFQFGQEVYFEN